MFLYLYNKKKYVKYLMIKTAGMLSYHTRLEFVPGKYWNMISRYIDYILLYYLGPG